jgi:streptomycin 6-kinase
VDVELRQVIADHVAAVERRTRGGAYEHELDEVKAAATAVDQLVELLQLGAFVDTLTPPTGKPQLLLEFATATTATVAAGRTAVLKVYGRARPGEAIAQRRWAARGVPVPEVLQDGELVVDGRRLSWLLMERLHGAMPADPADDADEAVRLTHVVAAAMATAHEPSDVPATGNVTALRDGVEHHLVTVVDVLVRHGYEPPDGWRELAASTYAAGRAVLLHGDLAHVNLFDDVRGTTFVLDACGYVGDAAFDAARWCARTANATAARPGSCSLLVDAWLAHEPLDRTLLDAFLALEHLMEAGVREIRKDEQRLPSAERDDRTEALLRASSRHMQAAAAARSGQAVDEPSPP